jgi:hypothetical protein
MRLKYWRYKNVLMLYTYIIINLLKYKTLYNTIYWRSLSHANRSVRVERKFMNIHKNILHHEIVMHIIPIMSRVFVSDRQRIGQ